VIGAWAAPVLSTGPHLHFELPPARERRLGALWILANWIRAETSPQASDAIALLMGQLLESLERPKLCQSREQPADRQG